MADDLIRYDVLLQDALRGVVRKVMREVADSSLPGEHHFYIAFDTTAPGVRMSSRLRQQHPQEMTIVLQHQFWDLAVTEHSFEVGLSFGGVPERLLVPFAAVKGFFDPSVQFGLQFEPSGATQQTGGTSSVPTGVTDGAGPVRGKFDADNPASLPALVDPTQNDAEPDAPHDDAAQQNAEGESGAEGDEDTAREGAEVVSLDAFRKKT